MIFTPLRFPGAWIIDLERREDERGFFARTWCAREFADHGIETRLAQCNVSYNHDQGTLRGLHYQVPPAAEGKLVRCVRGEVYDVLVDLRPESPFFLQWQAVELTAENRRSVFIPAGFAHGFQTLAGNTEIFYQMTEFYAPQASRGVRWNDPLFGVRWPLEVTSISPKDSAYPDSTPENFFELRGIK